MKVLCFGEIIWDINKGNATLGGAPLNVAGHLAQLGAEAIILSAVGEDEYGGEALKRAALLGIDTSFVHLLKAYETGKAFIELKEGIPSYHFNEKASWDAIELTTAELERLKSCSFDAIVFGTLAQRGETTSSTLKQLFQKLKASYWFFDVNLRLSFYNEEIITAGLKRADILKMNDEEVPIIFEITGCKNYSDLAAMYNLKTILVTKGKHGSECYENGEIVHQGCAKVKVVDSIGAGDSLSAAFLYFKYKGEPLHSCLSKASRLADYVVSQKGAIPQYSEDIKTKLLL